jgi:hypothetical protein
MRMERHLRDLVKALTPLVETDARAASKKFDLRLTGIAPGSLYMGLAIGSFQSSLDGMKESDNALMAAIRSALQSIQIVSGFVTDADVSHEIVEALPDPALRDAVMLTAYEISPTGRKGIKTLELSAPRTTIQAGRFSQHERTVLKKATERPVMKERKNGSFSGQVREIDLDSGRFQVRGIKGVGTLRCAARFDENLSKKVLGQTITVYGLYDSDRDGRPRLMEVSDFKIHPEQKQKSIPEM